MADHFDPAERLLASAPVEPGSRLLILEGGAGALLEGTAKVAREIHFHNSDCLRHAGVSTRLRGMSADGAGASSGAAISPDKVRNILGDLPRAGGSIPPDETWPDSLEYPPGSFDAVLYRLGKGTAALHGAIRVAWELLREGGALFIAGHTREGIKSLAQKTEEHFGNAELLGLKASCRLLRFRKEGKAPADPIPDPGYFKAVHLSLDLPGLPPLDYVTKPGVFSYRATDAGTALLAAQLAKHRPYLEGRSVLDLGCGCGPLSMAALRLGASEVTAVDSNAAAVAAAKLNLQTAGSAARIHCTNLMDNVEGEFDAILSNPPFHEGAGTDYGFPGRVLDAALPRLAPGGHMMLVANQFLDYPAQAARHGATCTILAHDKGYKVYLLAR